ncbi:TPA: autotransporter adhesin NhhA [Neisseria meningitidis]|jgi:Autotransporter adhesin|uniref:Autotransporter adhesin NhhA n=3 Tax=Neisseria meningitidis TaxID=487 RepID=NHHA_NEIMB|nr:autotransporter adhesin NhhA [Neisseria meningitidis]Q7DDJ2.1 RecName: Full=Autotransporter adhesin NhhA; AltName: Full=Neisseria hia homolog; AltName: Full=Type 5 secretion system autotransporter NhhA; Flags: Precursor [Neisseria meningitidis MC58]AJC62493.1 adhesin [Neisseria meningitidis LNP21362]AAF41395.1 adhesin [Neisseria meningitidis MC58]AAF42516.1 outer membrane protein GNA992 [Neisseria meningitidis]AAF42519.1 outer membrane protein GNA992 [Neisseria meningitidis]AAF42523.1 oute
MNKIYRIIWNSALNAWVVVSELTRNHTKRASATVKTAVLATLLFATVQASANNEEQEEDLYLDPVQRTVAVLIVNSDKEGTGEKEKVEENSDWAVYFNEKGVLTAREITLKAGDNLKIKQNGTNFTYSLKKDLTDLTSVGTEKLSFSANGNKVNITSDTKGLNFAKETAGTNGDTTVHLNGIGSTLTDTLLNTGATTNVTNDNVTDDEKKRAASVKDVLNAGWNIKGVKPGTTASDNVDFVRTYDTVEFLSADTKTTTVNVESKDNGKKTEVKIGAKTSVIKEKDGKLVTGKDKGENGSSTDEGEGLVTAKEVIDAVNKAGWRMKTTTANGQTGQADKFETVTSGTNVTFASGKGTTATVSKDDQGNITVMYDVNVGDALNVNQLQNSGWNLDSKAVAGSSGKVISGNVSPSKGKMDETVNINAGNNIEITRNGKNIDIATSMTPQFSSVSLGAGADAPTLSVDGDALNVGSKKDNKPVRITNVAPGVKEGDVTNVAQLKGVAQNLNNRIDNVDGNARAGIAQAIATAGLVQAYLPGKSMMAIGGGTYRGEAGYAIGYSSISDGGNWIIKGTASGNSRGHFGASASVGYQW